MINDLDKVWLTNSYEELKPIVTVEEKNIVTENPGLIWKQLFSAYQKLKSQN